ncbi:ABC transporter ATP-binding protein [Streptomyces sp. MST-110588]|uniref:ABC transporter ATP-binding protein n=1 Tax=Streptomyces sp. MST-110588 TaxID=2833628 RepID=UPI001F5E1339|nr:ABC transporter ATP-binding protein [Streptomyces sp. MST-110588]UNO39978.1 ABC transporter ATP-binding protein [Streptomyces sp. MST-110588]
MTAGLPVAEPPRVRRAAAGLIRRDGRMFAAVIALNALAAGVGLAGPWLLGRIVDDVKAGAGVAAVDGPALVILAAALTQLLLTRWARHLAYRFGERTTARVREQLADRALALPASVVERAGTGDLMARGTSDVAAVGATLRDAAPDVFVALLQALFLLIAVFVVSPVLGGCALLGLAGMCWATRWYLRRARTAYLTEAATDSALAEVLTATAAGARTVEAFGLHKRRVAACDQALESSRTARTRTLSLRSVLLPAVDVSYALPVVLTLLLGGLLQANGLVSLGAVITCALYLRQLPEPLDAILLWAEQLQSTAAAFARIEGLAPDQPVRDTATPAPVQKTAHPAPASASASDGIEATEVTFSYDGGPEVLHGISLTVRPGERLALVGPSGAGKSTLGRLLAGIDHPTSGTVTVGGVPLAGLHPEQLRRQVVLVSQEHHVFLGTVRDNLLIAAPDATDPALRAALLAVGADWYDALPHGLDTELGPRAHPLNGAHAQQLALARVVLADPHTVILDEATALLDPTTARHTERALAAVLKGRTVIAIAHRLHTAHDADRIAVLENGHLAELGPHTHLLTRPGPYAALWTAWH